MADASVVEDQVNEDQLAYGSQSGGRNAYRAHFSFAARPDSLSLVLGQFADWLRDKHFDVDLNSTRYEERGRRTLTVAHNDKTDGHQVRCTLVEQRAQDCWRTEFTLFSPTRSTRGWANLAVSSDRGFPAEPPRVFAQIVAVLHDPRDGALPLHSEPPVIAEPLVGDVIEWITDSERHALLFIAGSDRNIDFEPWVSKVGQWASGMKGMAQTIVLDPRATNALARHAGHAHAVSPWTIRSFQPGALLHNAADGHRHRTVGTKRLVTGSSGYRVQTGR